MKYNECKKISKNSIFQKFYVIYFSNIQNSRLFAVFCHFISQLFPLIRIFQENPQMRIHRFSQMSTDFEKKPQITKKGIHRFAQMDTDFERKPQITQMSQILEDKETTDYTDVTD